MILEILAAMDALSNSVFFFCNKSHRLLKIIFWNKTGFWLAQKRLEMATWPWPNTSQEAREFASKTESLKKLYESQPFLFDAEEMGIKIENQCPEISDEDIAQALNDDDLFDRKSERKSGLLSIPLQHQNCLPIYSSASI